MNLKKTFAALAGAAVLLFAVLSVACGSDSHSGPGVGGGMMAPAAKPGVIDVHLSNWSVDPATASAKAGSVTFRAIHDMGHMHGGNEGGFIHDLAVARKNADGSMEVLGQVKNLAMGEWKELTLDLPPGDYELQCNAVEDLGGGKIVAHYVKGMHTAFTVTA